MSASNGASFDRPEQPHDDKLNGEGIDVIGGS